MMLKRWKAEIIIKSLRIIYGPPLAGKTTYVKRRIGKNDIVIDLDYIKHALTYRNYHDEITSERFDYIWKLRNLLINNPKEKSTTYLLTTTEINENLSVYDDIKTISIIPSKKELYERIMKDDSRTNKESWKEIVDHWFNREGVISS